MLNMCPAAVPSHGKQASEPEDPLSPTAWALCTCDAVRNTGQGCAAGAWWLPELLGRCARSQHAVVRGRGFAVASGQVWLCLWPAHGAGSRPRPHPELPYLFGISTVSSEQQRPRVRPPAHCRRPQLIGRRPWRAQGPLPPSPPPPGPRSPPTPRPF